jgi:hypothetical protein
MLLNHKIVSATLTSMNCTICHINYLYSRWAKRFADTLLGVQNKSRFATAFWWELN